MQTKRDDISISWGDLYSTSVADLGCVLVSCIVSWRVRKHKIPIFFFLHLTLKTLIARQESQKQSYLQAKKYGFKFLVKSVELKSGVFFKLIQLFGGQNNGSMYYTRGEMNHRDWEKRPPNLMGTPHILWVPILPKSKFVRCLAKFDQSSRHWLRVEVFIENLDLYCEFRWIKIFRLGFKGKMMVHQCYTWK